MMRAGWGELCGVYKTVVKYVLCGMLGGERGGLLSSLIGVVGRAEQELCLIGGNVRTEVGIEKAVAPLSVPFSNQSAIMYS